ncbi:MAG TPA: hypothetical protein VHC46_03325 [Thermodesulfobacteriota bacterium]|nr:hypothetical protein [Thermodesulfobacteriota bacterium]
MRPRHAGKSTLVRRIDLLERPDEEAPFPSTSMCAGREDSLREMKSSPH